MGSRLFDRRLVRGGIESNLERALRRVIYSLPGLEVDSFIDHVRRS